MPKGDTKNDDLLKDMGETGETAEASQEEVDNLLEGMEDTDVTSWNPQQVGDQIQGTVTEVTEIDSEYHEKPVPALIVVPTLPVVMDGEKYDVDPEEEWMIRCYGSVIQNEVQRKEPVRGDTVAVKFFGKKQTKDGKKTFKSFKIRVVKN